jgi:hypothetical protein
LDAAAPDSLVACAISEIFFETSLVLIAACWMLREISLIAWVAVDNCCIVPLVAFRSGAERAIEHTTFDRQFALIKPTLNYEGGASITFRNVVEGRATARWFGRLASAQRVSPGAARRGRDRWRSAAGSGMDWQNPRDERGFAVP